MSKYCRFAVFSSQTQFSVQAYSIHLPGLQAEQHQCVVVSGAEQGPGPDTGRQQGDVLFPEDKAEIMLTGEKWSGGWRRVLIEMDTKVECLNWELGSL